MKVRLYHLSASSSSPVAFVELFSSKANRKKNTLTRTTSITHQGKPVQSASAGINVHDVLTAYGGGKGFLKRFDLRADAEVTGLQDLVDGRDIGAGQVGGSALTTSAMRKEWLRTGGGLRSEAM